MGIFSKIFGTDTIIKKGMDLVDEAFYTDEEKADDKQKMASLKINNKIKLLEAYAPFKVAQRYLAVLFAIVFLGTYIITLVMYFLNEDIKGLVEVMKLFSIDWIMLTIVAFYFGGGFMESKKRNETK